MASTTAATFDRERARASVQLEATAQYNADLESDALEQVTSFLVGLAEQESITSLDPAACAPTFQGLESVADQGSVYLLAADRRPLCSLLARRRPVVDVPEGDWFARTMSSDAPTYGGTRLEPATGTPQIIFAVPVHGAETAVLVAVIDTAIPPLETPPNASAESVVIEPDTRRQMVVSVSEHSPVKPGRLSASSWLRMPLGADHTRTDADGVTRIYEQVRVENLDRIVLAGVPVKVALQQAYDERSRNLRLGAAILVLVGILGLVVQRRVARPIANLQAAIRDAGDDGTVTAVVSGPAEIVALADEFNATMAKRRDLEVDLAASVARAEDASRMKSLFLANVSHEIRTPMNGVLGMITLFRDEHLSETQADYLDTMEHSAGALLAIINDLLDFSKIEAGMVAIEAVGFPLAACVRAAAAPWVPVAKEKHVTLRLTFDPGLPETVMGDPMRLRQVVSNLVDNAVKFTSDGAVDVRVKPAGDGAVRIEVADTGIGLGRKNSADLFDAFVQGDPSTTRRFGGTGLGLAICKQLVTLMHGTIDARARTSGGSVFWFELPLPESEAGPDAPLSHTVPILDAPPRVGAVLLAEDNPVNQKVAKALIEHLGFRVDVAADGAAAIQMASQTDYVAILMDLQMPNIDGFEATRAIRRELHSQVPIFALSASVLPEDRSRCTDAGMDGHLAKPIDRVALQEALDRAVRADAW